MAMQKVLWWQKTNLQLTAG